MFLKLLFQNFFAVLVLSLAVLSSVEASTPIFSEVSQEAEYLKNLGAYYWQKGDYSRAIASWKDEVRVYNSSGDKEEVFNALYRIASAQIKSGQERLAISVLESNLPEIKDPELLSLYWNMLGNAYSLTEDFEKALLAYQEGLKKSSLNISSLNNLALLRQKQANLQSLMIASGQSENLLFDQDVNYTQEALSFARSAVALVEQQELTSPENYLSAIKALIGWHNISGEKLSSDQIVIGRKILTTLGESRDLSLSFIEWSRIDSSKRDFWLKRALETSQKQEDNFSLSLIYLELGLQAEQSSNFFYALELARLSQLNAQLAQAMDVLYRAHWLEARIHNINKDRYSAITSYKNAVFSLESKNKQVLKIGVERRLNFNEDVESLYRELLGLLLASQNPKQHELKEALEFSERLRLAQLQRYFGDNCVIIKSEEVDVQNILNRDNAIAISSIILDEQTHLFLQLQDGTIDYKKLELKKQDLIRIVENWYLHLKQGNSNRYREGSRKLYDYIIRPFFPQIAKENPQKIIFIHDGILRNAPMPALMDGDQFFVQNWSSVNSMGFNFKITKNDTGKSKVIAFGLEKGFEEWSALDQAEDEVKNIINIAGGIALINKEFTRFKTKEQLQKKQYSIVHFATHAYFGGISENSFIVAYRDVISANELEEMLLASQGLIDLLVLSACETALGNNFSFLGISGIALRSNVASVLGTLWSVQDIEQAQFMEDFYRQLQTFDKATSLQKVQVSHIEQNIHPAIWAGINLVEN